MREPCVLPYNRGATGQFEGMRSLPAEIDHGLPASYSSPALFAELAPDWLAAVARRHSRRAYQNGHAAAEKLDAIERVCRDFRPHDDARVVLVRDPVVDVFTGAVGSYGKVAGAPHVLVFIADERGDFSHQHAGYTGEAVVLEAARNGLDTCWVGGFFDPARVAKLVGLGTGERALAVSPLGHGTINAGLVERAMRGMAGAHRRRTVAQIAPSANHDWPDWAIAAVETARLAPSALNRQPWRFRLEDDALVVAKDSALETPKVTKRLDCGIAMLHAELGAVACGAPGSWKDLAGADVARYRPIAAPQS